MDTPAEPIRTEIEVRRSRFITHIVPLANRAEAEAEISRRRGEYADASHVVYAFITGDPRSEVSGMSDDGEPKGTAGRPVMEILKGSGLTNTLVTVVRYFGGTKLGTGGLVRAYGDAARAGLALVRRVPYRLFREYKLTCPYELHQAVRTVLSDAGAEIQHEAFLEQVMIQVALEEGAEDSVSAALRDVSRGTLILFPV